MNAQSLINQSSHDRRGLIAVCVFCCIFFLMCAGCTEPADPQIPSSPATIVTTQAPDPVAVTTTGRAVSAIAEKPDATQIVITFQGGTDSDQMMELASTVTDSKGTVRMQSMGSRLGTTPVQRGGSITIYGPFSEKAHVVSVGYFSDGTYEEILNTWI